MARESKRKKTREEALRREEVIAGYRRLAFGTNNDALRLLFYDEAPPPEELAALDIFNVSDIKRPKNGGMEIRFFDRCEALMRLEAMDGAACADKKGAEGARTFYDAIAQSIGD